MLDVYKQRIIELLLNDAQCVGVQYFIPTHIADRQYIGVYERRASTNALAVKLTEMFESEATPLGFRAIEGEGRITMRNELYVMTFAQRRELHALFMKLIREKEMEDKLVP